LGAPANADEQRANLLLKQRWYYSVELLPGAVAEGAYSASVPMLPRLLMRRCNLAGMDCLDLGTMEGLMPVLMARSGARRVVALDGADHCLDKLEAVKHYYDVSFEYRTVGPMYSLSERLDEQGFDLINCSGLLYHVLSPLMVVAGLRGALKRGGLMIVSTNVFVDRGFSAEFNAAGRLQEEPNTFWYLSTGLLDYMLRYLRLAPIDCLYTPHEALDTPWRMKTEMQSGYAAVLCRAVDRELPASGDIWMTESARGSWEYRWIPDWDRADSQALSRISATRSEASPRQDLGFSWRQRLSRATPRVIDLTSAIEKCAPVLRAETSPDSHLLSLTDES
jgi:SAM-dependent methyltransferase